MAADPTRVDAGGSVALRDYRSDDLEALVEYWTPTVRRYLSGVPGPGDRRSVDRAHERILAAREEERRLRLDLHRVWATVHPENTASIRVREKAGMTYEGTLRGDRRMAEGWRDSLLYAVVRRRSP
jgi:RimJ/RimL family protein N-acetyltransferase